MSNSRRKRSDGDVPIDREAPSPADGSATEQGGDVFGEEDQIRARAYELYLERGGGPSGEMGDWLRAEREYRKGRPAEGDSPPPAA
jgi:hypothetical protein